jgi:putative transposase
MCLRWTAAGMLEAESRFRKVDGYRGLATIAVAIDRDLYRRRHHLKQEVNTPATV